MNYQKHYDLLINKAQSRTKPFCYCENHHILPKALGGSNDKTNLVWLTAREHCFAHLLLAKIYGGKMWHAVIRMLNHNKIKSSNLYGMAKENSIKLLASGNKGKPLPENTKIKISLANKNNKYALGYKHTPEALEKMKRPKSNETKLKMSKASKGKPKSKDQILNQTGSKSHLYKGCTIAENILTGEKIQLEGKIQIKAFGFDQSAVSKCILGKQKSHKGFIFSRKVL